MRFKSHKLLSQLEGIELQPYKDAAELLTIGIGHLLTATEKKTGSVYGCLWRDGITHEQAIFILDHDLVSFTAALSDLVKVPLTQPRYDALLIFIFNIGIGAFTKSTLLKELNKGNYDAIPGQLRRWTRAGGRVVKGLVNRREAEIQLWNSGGDSGPTAHNQ